MFAQWGPQRYDCLGAGAWGSWSPCPPCPPLSGCSQPGGTATSSRAPHSPAGGKRDLVSGRGLPRVCQQLVTGLSCEAMARAPSTPSCAPPRWPGVGFLTKCFLRYWAPCSVLHPGDATDSCLQPSSGMEAWPGVAAGALACEWPRLLPPGRREEPDASPSQRGNPQFREEIWEETKGAPALWRRHCEMSTHWCGEGEASTHFCP